MITFLFIALIFVAVVTAIGFAHQQRNIDGAFNGLQDLRFSLNCLRHEFREHLEANRKSHLHFDELQKKQGEELTLIGRSLSETQFHHNGFVNAVAASFEHIDEVNSHNSDLMNELTDHLGLEYQEPEEIVTTVNGEVAVRSVVGGRWVKKETEPVVPEVKPRKGILRAARKTTDDGAGVVPTGNDLGPDNGQK